MFGVEFARSDLPCLQTAINFMDKGHVVAKMQAAAEAIINSDKVTLHTDGTSQGGDKIIGHQIF
jgi:hypothetical protein